MNHLVQAEPQGPDKRSFALHSLAEDEVEESGHEIDTSFLQEVPLITS